MAVLEYPKATAVVRSAMVEIEGGARRQFVVCGTKGTYDIRPLEPPKVRVALDAVRGDLRKGYQDLALPKSGGRYDGEFADLAKVIRGEKEFAFTPEHDLAVLQAKKLPDDLQAATLRSTSDLQPGDEVIAVGFPFGIGPSVSSGVISGLRREYRSPQGKRQLTNLIQFDAAANPGNSGGPLVTNDGEVVGIVTAILNPTEEHVFIGIGFAVPIESAAAAVGISPF